MIKLMTFNIRYATADDGENRWERRRTLVIDRIKSFDPDLLGLQECRDDSQAEFIKHHLPDYSFHGVSRGGDSGTALEMAPVLFKKSVFEFVQEGTFWLSETPHVRGSKDWGVFPRTATWMELVHQPTGRALLFLNTHFDYESTAIDQSARLLKHWLEQSARNRPLLVTGDFNADKSSLAYHQLTGGSPALVDVYRRANPGGSGEGTYHGYGHEVEPAPIDWVLASGHFEVLKAEVDRTQEGNLYPSDHCPITATLNWKSSQAA